MLKSEFQIRKLIIRNLLELIHTTKIEIKTNLSLNS
jgi:hypothetical protein